jgi:hypothetical protein
MFLKFQSWLLKNLRYMIGTQLRMVGQNSDTGKYSKERELGDVARR